MEANINTIARGRSTNLAGGFLKGLQVVLSRVSGADSASVLLPTDGHTNVGLKRTQAILRAMKDNFSHKT